MHPDLREQPGDTRSRLMLENTESEMFVVTEAKSILWTLMEKSEKHPSKWSPSSVVVVVVVVEPRVRVVTVGLRGRG